MFRIPLMFVMVGVPLQALAQSTYKSTNSSSKSPKSTVEYTVVRTGDQFKPVLSSRVKSDNDGKLKVIQSGFKNIKAAAKYISDLKATGPVPNDKNEIEKEVTRIETHLNELSQSRARLLSEVQPMSPLDHGGTRSQPGPVYMSNRMADRDAAMEERKLKLRLKVLQSAL